MANRTYAIDENGVLFMQKDSPKKKNGSSKYSKALNKGIKSDKTITIRMSQKGPDGNDIDKIHRGGLTTGISKDGKTFTGATIYITGHGYNNMRHKEFHDVKVDDSARLILMHEIAGHAVPMLYKKNNSIPKLAGDNENAIRKQLHIEEREVDYNDYEWGYGEDD